MILWIHLCLSPASWRIQGHYIMLWMCLREMPKNYTLIIGSSRSEKSLTFMQKKFTCNRKSRENWKEGGLLHIKGTQPIQALFICFNLSFLKTAKAQGVETLSPCQSHMPLSPLPQKFGVLLLLDRLGWQRTAIFKAKKKKLCCLWKVWTFWML